MHKHTYTYWGVAELSSRRLVSRAGAGVGGGGCGSRGGGRERGPPAEDEARATVGGGGGGGGLGVRVGIVLVSEGGLRDVDPLLLPLPDWAGEHCGGCAVPGRSPAQSRPDSLHHAE